ncbi:MAG: GDP-mannose 4,6-dehydratase [Vicinamibacterales bacterium]
MTVLVTGAGGFAGGHLVELLKQRGPVTGWTRRDVDLLDRDAVHRAVAALRPTHVYHCAGSPHVSGSWEDSATPLASNVIGTHHLLEALSAARCRARVVVVGSALVYAPSARALTESDPLGPSSPYAVSKLAQEQLALRAVAEDDLEVIVARAFNHIGPRQSAGFAASSFARQIARIEHGEAAAVIRVGNLEAQRDLTDVRDTVAAYAALMEHGRSDECYNVASGVPRSIRAVLDALVARARTHVSVEVDPARMRPNDTPVLLGDAVKLRNATGWTPQIPFERTIDDLLDYWRATPSA